MSKNCELSISLDRPDRTFPAGGILSGHVDVFVKRDCECQSLTLGLGWKVRGKGNPAASKVRLQELPGATWRAGENHRVPFRIKLPPGPVSHRGELFTAEWYVQAEAKISSARDASVEETIFLVADSLPPGTNFLAGDPLQDHWKPPPARKTTTTSNQLLLLIVAGVLIATALLFMMEGTGGSPLLLPMALGSFFAGVGLCAWAFRSEIAELNLGDVAITPDRWEVPRGEEVTVRLEVPKLATEALSSGSATITLFTREMAVRGSGRYTSYFNEILHEDRKKLPLRAPLQATFTIPPDAPLAFFAKDNSIAWEVQVEITATMWPTFKRAIALDIVPAVSVETIEATEKPDETSAEPVETAPVEELGPVW